MIASDMKNSTNSDILGRMVRILEKPVMLATEDEFYIAAGLRILGFNLNLLRESYRDATKEETKTDK